MSSPTKPWSDQNEENDFLDMVVGTAVATIIFMGIAAVATVISLLI